MKTFLFCSHNVLQRTGVTKNEIHDTLNEVAENTNTQDLVVSLYIRPGIHENRGTAYVRNWMSPKNFSTKRGKWAFTSKWETPSNLPTNFKLIRIRLDGNPKSFPRKEKDRYGWEFSYISFLDHLAILFAHELHHFRRYHLGFHPRGGEHSANRWALHHVRNIGFNVAGKRLDKNKQKRSPEASFLKRIPRIDPFSKFRDIKSGAKLVVTHDPKDRYLRQFVTVLRPIRSNSKRIVVQTSDGKTWRWPMNWLKIPNDLKV